MDASPFNFEAMGTDDQIDHFFLSLARAKQRKVAFTTPSHIRPAFFHFRRITHKLVALLRLGMQHSAFVHIGLTFLAPGQLVPADRLKVIVSRASKSEESLPFALPLPKERRSSFGSNFILVAKGCAHIGVRFNVDVINSLLFCSRFVPRKLDDHSNAIISAFLVCLTAVRPRITDQALIQDLGISSSVHFPQYTAIVQSCQARDSTRLR